MLALKTQFGCSFSAVFQRLNIKYSLTVISFEIHVKQTEGKSLGVDLIVGLVKTNGCSFIFFIFIFIYYCPLSNQWAVLW